MNIVAAVPAYGISGRFAARIKLGDLATLQADMPGIFPNYQLADLLHPHFSVMFDWHTTQGSAFETLDTLPSAFWKDLFKTRLILDCLRLYRMVRGRPECFRFTLPSVDAAKALQRLIHEKDLLLGGSTETVLSQNTGNHLVALIIDPTTLAARKIAPPADTST
jgi:hypothetical protein